MLSSSSLAEVSYPTAYAIFILYMGYKVMFDLGKQAAITDKVQKLRFYGDEFVFNTVSGMCYRVTPTAGLLLRALDEGAAIEELVDILQEHYDVERSTAMRDVELLLNHLIELGVIEQPSFKLKQAASPQ